MKREYVIVGALLIAALCSLIAWELLDAEPLTPIPDAVRKAFEDGG